MKKQQLWRGAIYGAGVLTLAVGSSLGTKTGLAISPINTIPFALSSAFSMGFSTAVFVFYAALIALQFLLRGRHRRWRDLLQLPFSVVFSSLLGLFDGWVRVPESLWLRLVFLTASILLIALGVTMMVNMRIVPNPADGMADTIGWALKKDMGFGKNILDGSCVAVAFAIDALFGELWTSVGVATVISAVFIGRAVHLYEKLIRRRLLRLAGLLEE